MDNKKLYRSRSERIIFGLCGGLGRYFNVDPTLIRILFVLLAIPGGFGLLAYLIISLITPLESGAETMPKEEMKKFAHKVKHEVNEATAEMKKERRYGGFRLFLGAIIIAAGFFLLFREIFPFYHFRTFLWPVLVILFGVYLLVKHK